MINKRSLLIVFFFVFSMLNSAYNAYAIRCGDELIDRWDSQAIVENFCRVISKNIIGEVKIGNTKLFVQTWLIKISDYGSNDFST